MYVCMSSRKKFWKRPSIDEKFLPRPYTLTGEYIINGVISRLFVRVLLLYIHTNYLQTCINF